MLMWFGLVLAIFGLVYGLRKTPGFRRVWEALPDDLRPFAPAALGATFAVAEALQTGRSLREALAYAAGAAMTAQLAHHGLKLAPGSYGEKKSEAITIPPPSSGPRA